METSVGAVRERNEDAMYVDPDYRYFVVADGMGGHAAGDVASALAVASIRATFDSARAFLDSVAASPSAAARAEVRELIERAVHFASQAIVERAARDASQHGMGTTLDVAVILGDEAFIAHVGDSRTYLLRDGAIRQATIDHTIAQAMQDAGALTAEEAATSPMRSMLCSALGSHGSMTIDHVHLELCDGDRLLLCTDGLYEYFDAQEIAERVNDHGARLGLSTLVAEANERGGHDNITGVVIELANAPEAQPVAGVVAQAVIRESTKPMFICVAEQP